MANAFDASSSDFSNSAQTRSWAHTCTGSDRFLWVGVMTLSSRSVSSVTYNGVSLTSLPRSGGAQPVQLWYLANPASGTNNIEVSIGSPNSFIYSVAASYTGVNASGQPDAQSTANSTGTSVTTTLTTVADNSWAILVARNEDSGDTDAGTNCTERVAGGAFMQLYDSGGPITPAGSFSMTVNNGGSHSTMRAMASFSPAGGAAVATPTLMMMGVGS
jgi:hypothetical protein